MNDERARAAQGENQLGNANREDGLNNPKDSLGDLEETKEPKVNNPRELDDARYAALNCRAHSDEARALVSGLTHLVVTHELAAGTRTNERKKKLTALRSSIERLLADLLQAQASQKARGYVFRSMRSASFTDCDVSYRVFRALVEALVDIGLLEYRKGFQALRNPLTARGCR